jgi:hypothetical protein
MIRRKTPAKNKPASTVPVERLVRQYFRRWGYDHETGEFTCLLKDDAPTAEYFMNVETEAGVLESMIFANVGAGAELRIKVRAKEGEGITATLLIDGQQVDTAWCRTARITCPHCGKSI